MSDLVTYDRDGPVSIVTMDDGKVNVFSFDLLRAIRWWPTEHSCRPRASRWTRPT